MKRGIIFALLAGLLLLHPLSAFAAKTLRVSMLPLYSADEVSKKLTLLSALLTKATGIQVEPVVVNNFKEYEQRLGRDIDIGYENANVYVRASGVHDVVAMASKAPDGPKSRGIIIARTDNSRVISPEDLKGKRVSIVGFTSATGYLSQRLTLLQEGIDTSRDLVIEEALDNKHENVIFSVYNGDVDAGFIREHALNQAKAYVPPSQIKVIKKTAFLPEWAISVNKKLPQETKAAIAKALIGLKAEDPVLKALKIDAIVFAQDRDFDPMRQATGLPVPVQGH